MPDKELIRHLTRMLMVSGEELAAQKVEIEGLREALRCLLSVQNAKWVPSEHVDEWLDAVQQSHVALGVAE